MLIFATATVQADPKHVQTLASVSDTRNMASGGGRIPTTHGHALILDGLVNDRETICKQHQCYTLTVVVEAYLVKEINWEPPT